MSRTVPGRCRAGNEEHRVRPAGNDDAPDPAVLGVVAVFLGSGSVDGGRPGSRGSSSTPGSGRWRGCRGRCRRRHRRSRSGRWRCPSLMRILRMRIREAPAWTELWATSPEAADPSKPESRDLVGLPRWLGLAGGVPGGGHGDVPPGVEAAGEVRLDGGWMSGLLRLLTGRTSGSRCRCFGSPCTEAPRDQKINRKD